MIIKVILDSRFQKLNRKEDVIIIIIIYFLKKYQLWFGGVRIGIGFFFFFFNSFMWGVLAEIKSEVGC